MIKYEDGNIEIECDSVNQTMQEASMLIMSCLREVQSKLPKEVPTDALVQDLFKSLRFAALVNDGLTEDEAFEKIQGSDDG